MTNGKLRTAIIGAGKMGQIHAKVYHQLPQSQLVAIVDNDVKKAKQLSKKYKLSENWIRQICYKMQVIEHIDKFMEEKYGSYGR